MTNLKHKIATLNVLRGMSALMVLTFHCNAVMKLPKYFNRDVFSFCSVFDSGVQVFFVLSGFVIFIAHYSNKEGDIDTLVLFSLKRFRRVFVPLWVVLLILTPIEIAGVFGSRPSIISALLSYSLLPAQGEYMLTVEWTLRHEILFYSIFLCFLYHKKFGIIVLTLWGVLGVMTSFMHSYYWMVEFIFNINHILFIFGIGVAYLYLRNEDRFALASATLGLILFATICVSRYFSYINKEIGIILYGLAAGAVIYGLSSQKKWDKGISSLAILGDSSYSLYLIHFPLVSALVKISVLLDRNLHLPLEAYFVGVILLCQMAAILFYSLVEKPLYKLAGHLMPGNGAKPESI